MNVIPLIEMVENEEGRLEALDRVEALIHTSESSFHQITALLQLALEIEMVSINFITKDKQILKARQGHDISQTSRDVAFCNIAIRRFEPLVIEDTYLDARVSSNPLVTGPPFLRSYIGAPLTTEEGFNLGTVCALSKAPRRFSPRDIEIVRKCAELVMDQLELRLQANQDFLTKLHNRRSFICALDKEIEQVRQHSHRSSVAIFDIDHFKAINDAHGHPVGDRILREVADIIVAQCRANDIAARIGGEEFAVLLLNARLEEANIWARRMRKELEKARFHGHSQLEVTASIGLIEINRDTASRDAVMKMGDDALYHAKKMGRNRVVVAEKS